MKTLTTLALFLPWLALSAGCNDSSADADDGANAGNSNSGGKASGGGTASSGGRASGGGTGGRASGGGTTAGSGGGAGEDGGGAAGENNGGANSLDPQAPVPLGSSSTFAVLASAAITNVPTSEITGDIGLTPDAASNISGLNAPATCPEVTGTVYGVDASGPACATVDPTILASAKQDAASAFTNATAASRGTPQSIGGDLNGLTLYPGLYESASSLELSPGGFLYLDAEGDEDAIFILRSLTSITTESTSEVVLTHGAKAANVYWTAGSAVTLGTDSVMKGTLIAGSSISLLTGANLEGRALNQGTAAAAITLDACTIVVPSL
jgi:hypothetical protein